MKHNYKELKMWQKARSNNLAVYNLSKQFPKEELYSLTNQLRRSITSVASNIAEGSGYESPAQFLRYLQMALGSLCEAECQLILAYDLRYINNENLNEILIDIEEQKKITYGFIKSLKRNNKMNIPFWIGLFTLNISSLLNN